MQTGFRPEEYEHEQASDVGEDNIKLGVRLHLHVDAGGAIGPQ